MLPGRGDDLASMVQGSNFESRHGRDYPCVLQTSDLDWSSTIKCHGIGFLGTLNRTRELAAAVRDNNDTHVL